MKHGKAGTYNQGCRCNECRKAERERKQRQRERSRHDGLCLVCRIKSEKSLCPKHMAMQTAQSNGSTLKEMADQAGKDIERCRDIKKREMTRLDLRIKGLASRKRELLKWSKE